MTGGNQDMNKEQILEALKQCEESLKLAHKRLDELGTENKVLRELVHHLASRPAPYTPTQDKTIRIL
jgi:hypothetical protein